MARKKKKSTKKSKNNLNSQLKNILIAIFFITFWIISLFSTNDSIAWEFAQKTLSFVFWEHYKYIFSPIITILGVFFLFKENYSVNNARLVGLVLYLFSITTLIGFYSQYNSVLNISVLLKSFFGEIVWVIFMVLILMFSLFLMFRISYKKMLKKVISFAPDLETIKENISLNSWYDEEDEFKKAPKKNIQKPKKQTKFEEQLDLSQAPKNIKIEKSKKSESFIWNMFKKVDEDVNHKIEIKKTKDEPKEEKKVFYSQKEFDWWKFPPIDLLRNIWWDINFNPVKIEQKQQEIEDKLSQFKINVNMTGYRVWPTVIQYRLKPEEWVKLNKIVNLKNDLTLALHAKSIRIQAPIPWEGEVWIEVPNDNRQAVWLKEVIVSNEFNNKKLDIPIAVWKDVNGEVIVWDLTKMPHLLVAWQTASWKSVWMNGFIISMLYKFTPSELKMIMIDPKRVELSLYNWIPHLLTPVITSPDKALNSLKWAVAEMLRRYDLATSVNARNLKEYNAKVKKEEKLPYIVIIVDELADLMMSWNKKEVEGSIARIAQMARAVWMHLIVATQRPSVDVITWLIKANIPSRIAFTVASQIDSRTVIDKAWAEDLLWRWDMLYFPTWNLEPERVQGVLVETDEIESIVNQIKLTIDPEMVNNLYDDSIANGRSTTAWSILENYNWDQEEDPEIIEKAIAIVREAKKWSTSLIQRKLWLWYARAAKVLDILEELGVVWPSNWSKPREVYD